MSEPKDVHQRDQEMAALIDGLTQLAAGTAAYFNGLIAGGLERHEALEVTIAYATSMNMGATGAKDDESGEGWKKKD